MTESEAHDPPLIPGASVTETEPAEEELVEEGPAPANLDVQTPFERPDPTEAPLPADDLDRLIKGDSER